MDAAGKALSAEKFAELQKANADSQAAIAGRQKIRAQQEAENATRQKALADAEKVKAQTAEKQAISAEQQAKNEKEQAEIAEADAHRLRMVSLSQNVAFKSLQIKNDPQLAALLASEAYTLALDNKSNTQDPQIYNALFLGLKTLNPTGYPPIATLHSETKALRAAPNGQVSELSADGTLSIYEARGSKMISTTSLPGAAINTAYFSPDCRFMVTAYDDFSVATVLSQLRRLMQI